jgi:tetratricopeptide (TPR) repeat protein
MKRVHWRECAATSIRVAAMGAFFILSQAGAQHWCTVAQDEAAPQRGVNTSEIWAQAPAKPSSQSTHTEKVANPLNDLLDEAQRDIEDNKFEAAVTALQKILAEKPDIAWAHFQLGYAYTALKRSDEARAEYERAAVLDPKMSEAFLNLGILLMEKDPAAAVAPLRRAIDLLPAQSRPRFLLGVALERSGDMAAAAESYEAALRLDPRDADTAIHLGNLYLVLKRNSDAEAKFRAAAELQPKSPAALLGLTKALDAEQKPETVDAFRDYLVVNPSDAGARARLTHLLLDQKKYDEALAELDRADAGKPPTLDSLRSRADIQIAQKKWDDSVVTIRKAIALAPNDAQLHGGLGRVYLQKRDFPNAEKEIKVALQLDRNNLTYWKDLMSTYYLGGNYPATIATLDVIAKAETPGAGEWFIRALCYDKLNQTKPALEAYQKFLDLDQGKNPDQVWQAQQRSKVLQRMLDQKR